MQSQLSRPKTFLIVLCWVLFDPACNFRDVSASCFMLHRSFTSLLPHTLREPLTTGYVVPWTTSSWEGLSLRFEKRKLPAGLGKMQYCLLFSSCTIHWLLHDLHQHLWAPGFCTTTHSIPSVIPITNRLFKNYLLFCICSCNMWAGASLVAQW